MNTIDQQGNLVVPPRILPCIHKALAAVAKDLCEQGIAKNRKNQGQGFNFRGIDDVYNVLSPTLVEHGVLVVPTVLSREAVERQSKKGEPLYSVTLTVQYDFTAVADGSTVRAVVCGEGMDQGDKATSKALSMAFKYAAFQVFCIPVQGMPDADEESHTTAPTQRAATPATRPAAAPKAEEPYQFIADAIGDVEAAKSVQALNRITIRASVSPWCKGAEKEEFVRARDRRKEELAVAS